MAIKIPPPTEERNLLGRIVNSIHRESLASLSKEAGGGLFSVQWTVPYSKLLASCYPWGYDIEEALILAASVLEEK